jgi:hypothetical protein
MDIVMNIVIIIIITHFLRRCTNVPFIYNGAEFKKNKYICVYTYLLRK